MKSSWKRSGFVYIVILVAGVAMATFLFSASQKPTEIPLSEVITMSKSNQIANIVEEGEWLTIFTTDGVESKTNIGTLNYNDLRELGLATAVKYEIKPGGFNWGTMLISFLPLLLFGGLLFFLFFRARGANSQALSFGRSRARLFPLDKPTVTFDDVAGVEEAKQDLLEVVEFLKAREKFETLGARIPRGVLLIGPPGTGKTLLARAVAGEAAVPFFSISGSEFVEMFVGVGASRVRDLFDQAKRNTPCIIFVDEIDAVGRQRGAGLGGSHDEREQTLNQILTEMDGFDTNTSVIVVAATNRPDILDPALLRPGRFDRRVILDRPDITGRTAILQVHSKDKPLDKSVDLELIAKQTAGFSGADLANLVNEAAILAAKRDKKATDMKEFEESIDRVIAGPERKSRRVSPKEKEFTAYHEAGHALVGKILPNIDPLRKITIMPHGMTGGFTRFLEEDRSMYTPSQLNDTIATLLAGHTAEKLIFNEVTTGAQDDIKRATGFARKMVTDFGMSDRLGPRTFGHKEELVFLGREISEQRDYSDKVAEQIDDEVHSIIQGAHAVANKILTKNKPKLIQLAERLIDKETLESEELEALFNEPVSSPLPKSTPTATLKPVAPTTKKTKPIPTGKKTPKYVPTPPKTSPGYV
ncbi:ATP-dependent zinc metalloprotease FtsH [Chloroflexota bacterium]